MVGKVPHNALIVVADGTGARLFRNSGQRQEIALTALGHLDPAHLLSDGPAGHRPPESSSQETDEATFAKQLAKELNRRALAGEFDAVVLIADPQTLGQIRPSLHKEVKDRLTLELAKTLTKASVKDLENTLRHND